MGVGHLFFARCERFIGWSLSQFVKLINQMLGVNSSKQTLVYVPAPETLCIGFSISLTENRDFAKQLAPHAPTYQCAAAP